VLDTEMFLIKSDGVVVRELQSRPHFILYARAMDDEFAKTLGHVLNCKWPLTPNTKTTGAVSAFWLSPRAWLITCGTDDIKRLTKVVAPSHLYHVTDVTDSRVTFRIEGPAARVLLSKGCSLDLHGRVFASNMCAQTILAQIPTFIAREAEDNSFIVIADSSYRTYLTTWLSDACNSVGQL